MTLEPITLKCWPSDAVMIVGDVPTKVRIEQMRGMPSRVVCRDCRTDVLVDSKSVEYAMGHPQRLGRPVMFFCVECFVQYRLRNVRIEDLRPLRGVERPTVAVIQRKADA